MGAQEFVVAFEQARQDAACLLGDGAGLRAVCSRWFCRSELAVRRVVFWEACVVWSVFWEVCVVWSGGREQAGRGGLGNVPKQEKHRERQKIERTGVKGCVGWVVFHLTFSAGTSTKQRTV